jgi:hypothetical protein
VLPFAGFVSLGYLFVRSSIDLGRADAGEGGTVFGIGTPLVIGLGGLLLGVLLMIWWNVVAPAFFERKPEVADPALLTGHALPPEPVTR